MGLEEEERHGATGAVARPPSRAAATPPPLDFLVDGISEVLVCLAGAGTFTYLSASARELFGRPAEELVGTHAFDLIDQADRAEVERRFANLIKGDEGATDRITMLLARPDGKSVWVDVTGRKLVDPKTGERVVVAVVREATDRVETQRALKRVEERFRELVEVLPVVVYEAESGPHGRFHYVSPQIEALLGYTAEEWKADPKLWARSIHPDERERVIALEREQLKASARERQRIGGGYRMVRKDGAVIHVHDIAHVFRTENGMPLWRGVFIDVTAEESTRHTLAEAQERFDAAVDRLTACVYRAELGHDRRWQSVSAEIERLLGYEADDFVADRTLWRALLHAEDRDWVVAEQERLSARAAGEERVLEYRLRSREGRTVWVRDRLMVHQTPDGAIADGVLTDITAERTAAPAGSHHVDAIRSVCNECGWSWVADRAGRCQDCGSVDVEAVSLNATLAELIATRRQIEGLLDGIQRHLEALRTNMRSLGAKTVADAPHGLEPARSELLP